MKRLTLQTSRLALVEIDESYAEKVAAFYLRNKDFLSPWEPTREDDFYTAPYQLHQIRRDLQEAAEGRLVKLWIFHREDLTREMILGSVALNNIVRGCFQSAHLGYKIDGEEINKGYATEAVEALVEYAFNEICLHRIEANIIPRNALSLRVVEKLGFVNEGLARKYLKINGKWEDHIHMVILNEAGL